MRLRIDFLTTMMALGLGAIAAACVPSMPDGERGVQCWTDHHERVNECDHVYIRCLEDANPGNPQAVGACEDQVVRCYSNSIHHAGVCDWRSGCVDGWQACNEECSQVFEGSGSCRTECNLDFERCADWYMPECEDDCQEDAFRCLQATPLMNADAYIDCEDERLECVLDCY